MWPNSCRYLPWGRALDIGEPQKNHDISQGASFSSRQFSEINIPLCQPIDFLQEISKASGTTSSSLQTSGKHFLYNRSNISKNVLFFNSPAPGEDNNIICNALSRSSLSERRREWSRMIQKAAKTGANKLPKLWGLIKSGCFGQLHQREFIHVGGYWSTRRKSRACEGGDTESTYRWKSTHLL